MKAVPVARTGTSTDEMAEGDKVTRVSAPELVQNLDISSLDGDTAKVLLNKILISLGDAAKKKTSPNTTETQSLPKVDSSPPDEVKQASEILLGMKGVDQSTGATCQETTDTENEDQTENSETNAPNTSDDLACRTKSAISTLADLCTALRDVEPQVVNEVLPRRYHHLVPSTSAPLVQTVPAPLSKVSPEHLIGTEPRTQLSSETTTDGPSPKRIFIPGKTTIRPMPDYCRVIFHPSSPDIDNRKRRARTVFSAQQLKRLEEEYKKCSYPDKERRQSVADATGLTEGCVRIWYQNRRAKDHRLKDSDRQRDVTTVSSTSLEIQSIPTSLPVEPFKQQLPETAPSTTLNRAEETAMEALVNLSSSSSSELVLENSPKDAKEDKEFSAYVDKMYSETVRTPSCKNQSSSSDMAIPTKVANLHPDVKKTLLTVADSPTMNMPLGEIKTDSCEQVAKKSRAPSQPISQRAMIASLVAQTLKRSEGLDNVRRVVPIAVVNIPLVRVEGTVGKGMVVPAKSLEGSEKIQPASYVTVAAKVHGPNMEDMVRGSKSGDLVPLSKDAVSRVGSIGIPFKTLQFQKQWTKKSSHASQRSHSATTVTSKIQTGVPISMGNLPSKKTTISCTSASSGVSKASSLSGASIHDSHENEQQSANSSNPATQDIKTSNKFCEEDMDTDRSTLLSSEIPSKVVVRLEPRPTTVVGKLHGRSHCAREVCQPASNMDPTTSGTIDRKRKIDQGEKLSTGEVNKGRKILQTKMWRELKEEKSVAKRTKSMNKDSKKSSPPQMIQSSKMDIQYGDEIRARKTPTKGTTDSCTEEIAQTKVSGSNVLNFKNSHPATLHYKKGRVCQCHQFHGSTYTSIAEQCAPMCPETVAETDTKPCVATRDVGSLRRPREEVQRACEPSRQVRASLECAPKTWAPGIIRHLKLHVTTPMSLPRTSALATVTSFPTVGAVPFGSVRLPGITTSTTQQGRGLHLPTLASFRPVDYSKKSYPVPTALIPKTTTGQLLLNQKGIVKLKAARGVRVVVSHPSNRVMLSATTVCESGHTHTTPPTFTRPTVSGVAQRVHHTCGAAAMFRLGSVLKRPSHYGLPLPIKPADNITPAATTGCTSSGIRPQAAQNVRQLGVHRHPPLPQPDGDALRRLQRFTDGFMERQRSGAPSSESRRDDKPPPTKVRRTDA